MRETWERLFMDSVAHKLSFPTPTHMIIFGNHSSGYSHLNTTTCGVQPIAVKQDRK
jgi:hypothetical protein